ncbi:hypothetical protein BJF78_13120 [Pseudonocardia sp. CNS-139]|nr:hypothetical protein BJF78_13120 [Pseudonocardia sp. CNS-139]
MSAVLRLTRRLRGLLRREASGLLRVGPPTVQQLMRPLGPQVPGDARVQQVLDLCMQVGEVLLSGGESVDEVTRQMLRLSAACGLSAVDVDITFNSITMCCHRGMAAAPVTTMRLVRYRSLDLTRLAEVAGIVDRVERGELDLENAAAAVAEAVRAPHPYPRWVATAGWAGLAGAVALLLGGAPITVLAAFVVTALIDRTGRLLNRWGLPMFFQQVVGGMLATGATLAMFAGGCSRRARCRPWWSPPASRCCCRACRWSARCRTPSRATTSRRPGGPRRSCCSRPGCSPVWCWCCGSGWSSGSRWRSRTSCRAGWASSASRWARPPRRPPRSRSPGTRGGVRCSPPGSRARPAGARTGC